MKKFVCTVCGYVFEGEAAPAECPVCHAGADKFKEQTGEREWAAEHVIGVAQGVSEDILADLRANFEGECTEVGMYLAMARVAHREGYPEIGLYWEKAAWEEAEHASKFAELLGEVVTDSTKKNFVRFLVPVSFFKKLLFQIFFYEFVNRYINAQKPKKHYRRYTFASRRVQLALIDIRNINTYFFLLTRHVSLPAFSPRTSAFP